MPRIAGKCKECSKRTQGKNGDEFICRDCRQKENYEVLTNRLHHISDFDFGWMVGLIEGEGCFYCKGSSCKISSGQYCYPLAGFTIMSTDSDVMNDFGKLIGVEPKGPYYKTSNKKRKIVWSIQITGNRAIAVMNVFRSYLSKRRQEQIDKALGWQSQGRFKIA